MIDLRTIHDVERLPRPAGPAVILASAARFGYGHVARSLRVAEALVRRAPLTAYVVSPQPGGGSARRHARIHRIALPPFALAATVAPRWPITDVVSTLPGHSPADLTRHHGHLLAAVVRRLRPVGVLLDHFPFFLEERFYERALAALRVESPRALVCAGFRGVLSRAYDPAEQARVRELLARHADLLIVYADARETGRLLRRSPFLAPLRARMRFVGYVCPAPSRPRPGRRRILATFGSGVDAAGTIRLVCEAFAALRRRRPHHTLDVVTGGRLPDETFAQLVARHGLGRGMRIRRLVPGLDRRMSRYALVVAMGGYNTLTELYQSGTRGIVLPRAYPGNDEQGVLARKFRAFGGVDHVVAAARCRPARLARLMAETLCRPPAIRRALDTQGARQAAKVIVAQLARRGLLPA
jgi:predicted glycosyltransferase